MVNKNFEGRGDGREEDGCRKRKLGGRWVWREGKKDTGDG